MNRLWGLLLWKLLDFCCSSFSSSSSSSKKKKSTLWSQTLMVKPATEIWRTTTNTSTCPGPIQTTTALKKKNSFESRKVQTGRETLEEPQRSECQMEIKRVVELLVERFWFPAALGFWERVTHHFCLFKKKNSENWRRLYKVIFFHCYNENKVKKQ